VLSYTYLMIRFGIAPRHARRFTSSCLCLVLAASTVTRGQIATVTGSVRALRGGERGGEAPVNVTVWMTNGRPLPDITDKCPSKFQNIPRCARPDANGRFNLGSVIPGEYDFIVCPTQAYKPALKAKVKADAGRTTSMSLFLEDADPQPPHYLAESQFVIPLQRDKDNKIVGGGANMWVNVVHLETGCRIRVLTDKRGKFDFPGNLDGLEYKSTIPQAVVTPWERCQAESARSGLPLYADWTGTGEKDDATTYVCRPYRQ
jgi:hypothetical protein